ncbi:MAG: hypothetical protein LBF80_02040 [Spirochaetaceae bacterium]|jgi:hypothetical protein|nr:hypothetical protein [Spirochaetaceae bacterium]
MTVWDFLDKLASSLSPIMAMVVIIAMALVFIIGFSKHGVDFIKHGFKQIALDASLDNRLKELGESLGQRIDGLAATQTSQNEALGRRIDGLHDELDMIKNNHFGHLKSYLEILDGILLEKNIISNKEKALLDNEFQGMSQYQSRS